MNNKITRLALMILSCGICLFLTMFNYGCGKMPEKGGVLAFIGGTEITVDDFEERISHMPERYRDVIKKRKGEFLDDIINDTLLYQEALRCNLRKDKDVQKVIEQARKKILIARLLKDKVDDAIEITEEDIRVFYEENKSDYMTPEILRVSHILVFSREDADDILEEIAKGQKFEDMARAKSIDPTAQRGGDIGYFPKGQLMPEFEMACDDLDINEISGVVRTKLGYHIIKLTDRRSPELRPLSQVKEDIKSRLRTAKRRQIFSDLINRLRKETDIKIDKDVLAGWGEEAAAKTGPENAGGGSLGVENADKTVENESNSGDPEKEKGEK
ncbi:MAG: peptidylprolyl isomerase [Candidatus Omnitrophota bacterium]